MRYTAILGLTALAWCFTGCDDIEDSTGLPQTNPELPTVTVDNLPMTVDASTAQSINLAQFNDAGTQIPLVTLDTPADFPDGYKAEVLWFEIGNDANFTKKITIKAQNDADGNVTVNPDDWQAAQVELFGKNPAVTTTYVRVPAWAVKGNQQIRLKSENAYFAEFNTQVTPIDLFDGHVIEDAYYLVCSFDNFDVTKGIKFEHNDDYGPYDDPVFTVTIPARTQEWSWVVVPESTYAAGQFVNGPESSYGVKLDTEQSGTLMANDTQDYGIPGKVTTVNVNMSIKIDMEKLTYEIVPLILYTPGKANGWDPLSATQQLLTTDLSTYTGFAHLDTEFKFANPSTRYGAGDGAGTLSTAADAKNLTVDTDGLYWCSANLNAMSYSVTYIRRICIVGDASAAGWNPGAPDSEAVLLTPSADYLVWSSVVTLNAGNLKFVCNDSWDIQLGGSISDLINDGGASDIPGPGAGTYLVTVDLSSRPYTCTFTPQAQ